jgi:hypothetical protein
MAGSASVGWTPLARTWSVVSPWTAVAAGGISMPGLMSHSRVSASVPSTILTTVAVMMRSSVMETPVVSVSRP